MLGLLWVLHVGHGCVVFFAACLTCFRPIIAYSLKDGHAVIHTVAELGFRSGSVGGKFARSHMYGPEMEEDRVSHSLTSMARPSPDSQQQGMSQHPNLDSTSPASSEKANAKKKSRKRKSVLSRYGLGSSKRRRLASASSRKERVSNKGETLHDLKSSAVELQSFTSRTHVAGADSDLGAPQKALDPTAQDEKWKYGGEDGLRKCKGLELHVDLEVEDRTTSSSQAAHPDNADLVSSPSSPLRVANVLDSVQQSANDNKQNTNKQNAPDGRVLRPRRQSRKESKESDLLSADSLQIVGRRIEVFWPLDSAWYRGLVRSYDASRKKHKVSYDDGEEEWLYLLNEKFRFELSCEPGSAQSGETAQESEERENGCAHGDDLLLSAVSSMNLLGGVRHKRLGNGAIMSAVSPRKRVASGPSKGTSSSAGLSGVEDLSARGMLESTPGNKVMALKARKDAKFTLRKHEDTLSIGERILSQGEGGTDGDGADRAKAACVYVRRQKMHDARTEGTHQAMSVRGQQWQERSRKRRKQKQASSTLFQHKRQAAQLDLQGHGFIGTGGGVLEVGGPIIAAGGRPLQLTHPKRRNRQSLKKLGSCALGSQEGAVSLLDSLYSGTGGDVEISAHHANGQRTKRAGRKHKLISLSHTTLAADSVSDKPGEIGRPYDEEHKQKARKDLSMQKSAEPAGLLQQGDAVCLPHSKIDVTNNHTCKSATKASGRKRTVVKVELQAARVRKKMDVREWMGDGKSIPEFPERIMDGTGKKVADGTRGQHQREQSQKVSKGLQGFLSSDKLLSQPFATEGVSGIVNVSGDGVPNLVSERKQPGAEVCSGFSKALNLAGKIHQVICPPTPSGAASVSCKTNAGCENRQSPSDTRASKSLSCTLNSSSSVIPLTMESNSIKCQVAHDLARRQFSSSNPKLEINGKAFSQNPLRAFHSTIYLLRPDMILDLFTWQLFNIMKAVGLCNGDCFEGRFSWKGSIQDLASIVLLLMAIIKALPLMCQRCHRHWQGRVLHELWIVLSRREQWVEDLPAILPAQADELLMQRLRQLVSEGHCLSHMTFRQVLNIFVCYFIKPYVIAILCERGAQPTVMVQQFLLLACPQNGGISCERKSVKWVKLRSRAGAEADFSSYLALFPMSKHWCTGNDIFQKLMKEWMAFVTRVGYAEQSAPVPSVKFSNHLGLQFTTALIFSSKKFTPQSGSRVLHLQQNGGNFDGSLKKFIIDILRLTGKARDWILDGRFAFGTDSQESPDFFTGLCFTSMLQRCLHLAGGKSLFTAEVACDEGTNLFHVANDSLPEGVTSSSYQGESMRGRESCTGRVVSGYDSLMKRPHIPFKADAFKEEGMVKISERQLVNVISDTPYHLMNEDSCLKGEEAVVVGRLSTQNLSAYINIDSIKEESLLESCGRQSERGTVSDILIGSPPFYSVNDMVYNASGSSSNSSFESNTRWRSTGQAEVGFRPLDMGNRCVGKYPQAAYGDGLHLHAGWDAKKGVGSRVRPRRSEQETADVEQSDPYCSANVLITKGDRSWRELGARVELRPKGSEWLIAVQLCGITHSHKVLESTVTSKVNRHTHAMMWKGGDGWTLEFCDRKQWNWFKRMHEECGHRNARAASIKQIPIPNVKRIEESIEGMPPISIWHWSPGGLIRQTQGEVEAALNSAHIVYDTDCEDEVWLAEVNGGANRPEETISIEVFERIVDKLERVAYLRQGKMVAVDEVAELCQNIASKDAVLAIHAYWSKKRLVKDTALIRYFQSPLWEKYQKQFQSWQTRFNELQMLLPSASKEQLLEQCPRPPMFAFCLPSRKIDASNMSKRMQKQRSQKHLNSAFKYTRTSSFETSGFLQKNHKESQC